MSPHQQRIVPDRARNRRNTSTMVRLACFRRQSSRPATGATVRCTVRSIPGADIGPAIGINMERSYPPFDALSIDHNLADTDKARQFEHGVEQDSLEDRPQPAGPSLPQYRFVC